MGCPGSTRGGHLMPPPQGKGRLGQVGEEEPGSQAKGRAVQRDRSQKSQEFRRLKREGRGRGKGEAICARDGSLGDVILPGGGTVLRAVVAAEGLQAREESGQTYPQERIQHFGGEEGNSRRN